MSFLLLLSAMLSALTGAVSNGRVERQRAAICSCVKVEQSRPVRNAVAARRPDAGPLRPSLIDVPPPAFRLVAVEPLFATRRRE